MAIRLFVHVRNVRASVDYNSLTIVAPAFQKASVGVSSPTFEAAVGFSDLQAMASHRNLISAVYFRNANTTSLALDPDTLNRYFRGNDPVVISEQATLNISKGLVDQPVIAEAISSFDISKVLADTAAVTELINVTLIINRSLSDSFVFSDAPTLVVSKNFTESIAFSDDHTMAFAKTLADVVPTLTENSTISYFKALADATNVAENLSRVVSFIRDFADSTSVSENATISYGKNETEFLYMGEQHSLDVDKPLSDTATVADSPAISYSRPDSDSVTISESFSRVVTSARTFTETATVSDDSTLAVGLNKTDAVAISQVFGRTVVFNRTFTDAFTIDDSATVDAFTKDTQARKGNVVGVTDNFSRVFTAVRDFTDSVAVSDDPVLDIGISKSEVLSVLEQADITFSANKSDSLSLSEVESKQISKGLDESVSISDVLTFNKRSSASSLLNAGAINVAPINN